MFIKDFKKAKLECEKPEYYYEESPINLALKQAKSRKDLDIIGSQYGIKIIVPTKKEIQIDLDGVSNLDAWKEEIFRKNANRIYQESGVAFIISDISPSLSKNCYHVTVSCNKDINHFERVIYQIIFGSDIAREKINSKRVACREKYPIRFFEYIDEKKYSVIKKKKG